MILKFIKINVILFFISFTFLNANEIENLSVSGNQRISKETIQVIGKIDLKKKINNIEINNILKNLYASDFFEDIKIEIKEKNLLITVTENPIIENITISGIKKEQFKKDLKERISLQNRSSFTEFKLQKDLDLINNILKQSGYYFAKTETFINKNDTNNSINLDFTIELGKKAKIKSIQFIGERK